MGEKGYTVKTEFTEDRHAILTVEFDEKEVNRRITDLAKELRKTIRVPGYRPGKASTRAIIRYVGRESMLEEMAEKMSEEVLHSIIEEENLKPIGRVTMQTKFQPFTLVFRVPLAPEATLKEGYDKVKVEVEADEISDDDVQAVLERVQKENAQWVPHEDPVEPGDMITINLVVTADGEEILKQEDLEVVLEPGGVFMPEFVEQVTGMKPGETKTFNLTYPEDAKVPWAGKDATFEVTLLSAKRQEFPEIDDEFAREISDQEDLESLKKEVRRRMEQELIEHNEESAKAKALSALLEHAEVSYPEEAVEEQIDFIVEDEKKRIAKSGWRWDMYLRLAKKSEEEFREEVRPIAERIVKERAALLAFAKAEGIEVSGEEIDEQIMEIAEASDTPDEVRRIYEREEVRDLLKEDMLIQKALDAWLERTIVRPESAKSPEAGAETEEPTPNEENEEPGEEEKGHDQDSEG